MARGIRIYEIAHRERVGTAVQFHVFGVVPTSLAILENGNVMVWTYDCEESCADPLYPDWNLVYEGDAS